MKIELRQPYKSIQTLETEELPDFAILIGRNGAGKSQILNALKEGQAVIPGMRVDEIELYDMVSFSPPNANVADRQANQFARSPLTPTCCPRREADHLSRPRQLSSTRSPMTWNAPPMSKHATILSAT